MGEQSGGREVVAKTLREAATRLGEDLKGRRVSPQRTRRSRALLAEAWRWEQDPVAPIAAGQRLGRDLTEIVQGSPTYALSEAIAARLTRRWPLKLRCLTFRPMALALGAAQEMGTQRVERAERFLACFGVSPDKLIPPRGSQAYSSAKEYFAFGVVEKKGRT